MLDSKRLAVLKRLGRNMDFNNSSSEYSEVRRTEEKASILRECIYHHKQNVARERNIKIASGEALEGNNKYVIGHWKKGDLFL